MLTYISFIRNSAAKRNVPELYRIPWGQLLSYSLFKVGRVLGNITKTWRKNITVFYIIDQSINQLNFNSANIPGEARLSGAKAKSAFNSKVEETVPDHQQVIGHAGVYGGKAKSKRIEMAERTDSGRLFQTDAAQEWKTLAPVLVLTLGTDRLIPLFGIHERDGSDVASMEWR